MATRQEYSWFVLAQLGTCQLLANIFRALIGASTTVTFRAFSITGGASAPLVAAGVTDIPADEVVLFNNSEKTIQLSLSSGGDYLELPAKTSMTLDCISNLSEVLVRLDGVAGDSYTLRAIIRKR